MADTPKKPRKKTKASEARKKAQTKAARDKRKKIAGKCSWRTQDGRKCGTNTYYVDPTTGESFCRQHYAAYYEKGEAEHMQLHRTNAEIGDVIKAKKGKKVLEKLEEVPSATGALEEALDGIEKYENGHTNTSLEPSKKIRKQYLNEITRGAGSTATFSKAKFVSIDVEHYTPDFKDDHFFLLNSMIRRKHAVCNILLEQLLRMESEEEMIKLIETYGEQIIDGESVEFRNITKRHATPFELKMKLLETLNKTEKEYRELLKQRENTLMNSLMILKKFGIKFDKKSGNMVMDLVNRLNSAELENSGAIDTIASSSSLVREGEAAPVEHSFDSSKELQRTLETVEEEDW